MMIWVVFVKYLFEKSVMDGIYGSAYFQFDFCLWWIYCVLVIGGGGKGGVT